MRSGQIQQVIANGVAPFQLCRIVSTKIRTNHQRGGHIQDSIGAVFQTLSQGTAFPRLAPLSVSTSATDTAVKLQA